MTIIEVCGVDREAARRGWEGIVQTNWYCTHTDNEPQTIDPSALNPAGSEGCGQTRSPNTFQQQQRLTTPSHTPLINITRVSCGVTRPAAPRAARPPCPSRSSSSSSSCWRPPSGTRLWRRRRVACTLLCMYQRIGRQPCCACRRRVVCVRLVYVCVHRNATFLGKERERESRPIGFGFGFNTNRTDPSIHRLTHAIHPALHSRQQQQQQGRRARGALRAAAGGDGETQWARVRVLVRGLGGVCVGKWVGWGLV